MTVRDVQRDMGKSYSDIKVSLLIVIYLHLYFILLETETEPNFR